MGSEIGALEDQERDQTAGWGVTEKDACSGRQQRDRIQVIFFYIQWEAIAESSVDQ